VSSLPRPQLAAHRSGGTGVGDTDQHLIDVHAHFLTDGYVTRLGIKTPSELGI
jgi:hypothetical protein